MPDKHHKQSPKRSNPFLAVLLAIVLVVGAGGSMWYFRSAGHTEMAVDISGSTIPEAGPMPDWLMTANSGIKTEYVWAASHLAELQYIPCYCGCGKDGHTDNFSCYFDRDGNGKIRDYDNMSFT